MDRLSGGPFNIMRQNMYWRGFLLMGEKILIAYCTVEIPPGDYDEGLKALFAPDENGNPREFDDEETARLWMSVYGYYNYDFIMFVKLNGDRITLPNGSTFRRP